MKKALSIILIVFLVLLILVSCSSAKTDTDLAKEKIEEAFKALQNNDYQKYNEIAGHEMVNEEDDEETKKMMEYIFKDISWSYKSGELKEGKGELVYNVKAKDLSEIFIKLFSAALGGSLNVENDEEINKFIAETIKEISPTEKEITFSVEKEGEKIILTNMEVAMSKAIGFDTEDIFQDAEDLEEGQISDIEEDPLSDETEGEANKPAAPLKEVKIGETFKIKDYEITIHSFEKVDTWDKDGKALKMIYGWKNNSDSTQAASYVFDFSAFQNGVEVDSIPLSDSIDYSIGQKNVLSGHGQDNCETGFVIEGSGPMEIWISDSVLFDAVKFIIKVNPDNY